MNIDGTVTLGNVLTVAAVICGALMTWGRFGITLDQHSQWIKEHQTCNKKQIEILEEVRRSLAYLRGKSDAKREAEEARREDE